MDIVGLEPTTALIVGGTEDGGKSMGSGKDLGDTGGGVRLRRCNWSAGIQDEQMKVGRV